MVGINSGTTTWRCCYLWKVNINITRRTWVIKQQGFWLDERFSAGATRSQQEWQSLYGTWSCYSAASGWASSGSQGVITKWCRAETARISDSFMHCVTCALDTGYGGTTVLPARSGHRWYCKNRSKRFFSDTPQYKNKLDRTPPARNTIHGKS